MQYKLNVCYSNYVLYIPTRISGALRALSFSATPNIILINKILTFVLQFCFHHSILRPLNQKVKLLSHMELQTGTPFVWSGL